MSRASDLVRFYETLHRLEQGLGGCRQLAQCTGRQEWPTRGVYFFFEPGELRADAGSGARVTRVGTHALKQSSRSTLWGRLSQHRGQARNGAGNHRGSIFRLLLGESLKHLDDSQDPLSWGIGGDAGDAAARLGWTRDMVKAAEMPLELRVSERIGVMPFLFLPIDDVPGPESLRGYIERNSISLLSNFNKVAVDAPSYGWLGRHSSRARVRQSGLWNNNHVDECYDSMFLDELDRLVNISMS